MQECILFSLSVTSISLHHYISPHLYFNLVHSFGISNISPYLALSLYLSLSLSFLQSVDNCSVEVASWNMTQLGGVTALKSWQAVTQPEKCKLWRHDKLLSMDKCQATQSSGDQNHKMKGMILSWKPVGCDQTPKMQHEYSRI